MRAWCDVDRRKMCGGTLGEEKRTTVDDERERYIFISGGVEVVVYIYSVI